MNRRSNSLRTMNPILTAVAALLAVAAGTSAAQDCDCDCERYAELMAAVEDYKTRQDAGEPGSVPPELMQMSRCAGQCAMEWAQCANPDLDVERMKQARERMEARSAAAATEPAADDDPGLPKDRLTADYLEGMWCSVYNELERAQWRFHADGSYEVGLAAGRGWQMQKSGDSIAEFHERFEALAEMSADAFTTDHGNDRMNVFKRGPCG